ncbi:MAG TPA: M48 family metalloprotease [Patescibacteria group bacterium]|jgi:heat shock protein HtpX|nr:M48 family metalloprotease [Patescibacteria group bacterium]
MYSQIAANKRKTYIIMALFVIILGALGWTAGVLYNSPSFLYLALVFGGVYALIQYFLASKIAMAVNDAKEITKKESPRLYRAVENLAIAAGLPMPKVYIIDDPAPNAFATGRDPDHAIVAATSGLLDIMNDTELEAVIAHELGHVRNYDIRVMMIVFGLVAAISLVADILLNMMWFRDNEEREANPLMIVLGIAAAILAPLVASLVQLAVSRRREYLADSSGALLTRYPEGLASALEKIRDHGSVMQRQNTATAHFFFANPLKAGGLTNLFSTHPPIEDRIAKLRGMENKM